MRAIPPHGLLQYAQWPRRSGVTGRRCGSGCGRQSAIGLFKTEVIRRRGPWRSLEAVEFATLERVDWFNTRRLLEPIGNVPPAEAEAAYDNSLEVAKMAA